jgi:hypothetical protein
VSPAQTRDLAAVRLPEGWTITVHDDARVWGVSLWDATGREVGYAARRRGNKIEGWLLNDAGAARLPLSRLCGALWRLSYPVATPSKE